MYLLKLLRNHDNKDKYKTIISSIKKQTFKRLKDTKIDFTEETEIYKVLDLLFEDSMKANHEIEILNFNYLCAVLIINLYYRQCIRYNETGKVPDSANDIWNIDVINLSDIPVNDLLNRLIEETKIVHEQMSKSNNKR